MRLPVAAKGRKRVCFAAARKQDGQRVIVTNWRCCLVTPARKPLRPIVADVRDWLFEQARNDMRIVEKKYPSWGCGTR
ncbi:hypothetical protein [Paraburkholderia sp. LEh10]|uniref:hypothetical protein n=1 Tax=Paraburkholderia sp. LEh10 TaxID=2821353 RepID=UPI001FD81F06|nr:hypothetical protein [Paraburkholderia sp. LEh10]